MRKFIAETAIEFFEFASDKDNLPHNDRLDKKIYYDKFLCEYPDFKKWLTRKRFNIWIQKYCTFMDYEYMKDTSNGLQWFMIKTKELSNDDEIQF